MMAGCAILLISVVTLCCMSLILILFFFSSRRRHRRLTCDWSSDVCSSDLSRCSRWPSARGRWCSPKCCACCPKIGRASRRTTVHILVVAVVLKTKKILLGSVKLLQRLRCYDTLLQFMHTWSVVVHVLLRTS